MEKELREIRIIFGEALTDAFNDVVLQSGWSKSEETYVMDAFDDAIEAVRKHYEALR